MDERSIYLGGGIADTRTMRQDRYQIARNSLIHAELLVNTARTAIDSERMSAEQDNEITADTYKLARTCEALAETLRESEVR